jgi:hypothetical protein
MSRRRFDRQPRGLEPADELADVLPHVESIVPGRINLAFLIPGASGLRPAGHDPEHESGLASGLSNTAFQIGAALGVAIVTTVAVTRTDDYLAAHAHASPLVALTEGFQSAFAVVAILAGVGVALRSCSSAGQAASLRSSSTSSLRQHPRATEPPHRGGVC